MPKPKKGERTPGSGKPKGFKHQHTIEKELAKEVMRQQVLQSLGRMTAAQIEHSCGVSYIVVRQDDGTYARASDEASIDAAIARGDHIQIFTQSPNPASFKDLLDRALGKPVEEVQVTGEGGGPQVHVFRWGGTEGGE